MRLFRGKLLLAFIMILCLSVTPLYAEDVGGSNTGKSIFDTELSLKDLLEASLKPDSNRSSASAADQGYAAGGPYNQSKWIMTKIVGDGLGDLHEAAEYLRTKEAQNSYVSDYTYGGTPQMDESVVSSGFTRLAANLDSLNDTIGSDSLYDTMKKVGLFVLIIGFMYQLSAAAIGSIRGDHTGAGELGGKFFKFVILVFVLTFMKPCWYFGLKISDAVARTIVDQGMQIEFGRAWTKLVESYSDDSGSFSLNGSTGGSSFWKEGGPCSMELCSGQPNVNSAFGKPRSISGGKKHVGVDVPIHNKEIQCPFETGDVKKVQLKWQPSAGLYLALDIRGMSKPFSFMHLQECAGYSVTGKNPGTLMYNGKVIKDKKVLIELPPFSKGQIMAKSGMSGHSSAPHVHIQYGYGTVDKKGVEDPGLNFLLYKLSRKLPLTAYEQQAVDKYNLTVKNAEDKIPTTYTKTETTSGKSGSSAESAIRTTTGTDPTIIAKALADFVEVRNAAYYTTDENSGIFRQILNVVSNGFESLFKSIILWVMRYLGAGIIYVVLVVLDLMMAITLALAPLVVGLSFFPFFENKLQDLLKTYIGFLFYQPLASLMTCLVFAITASTLDSGFLETFILVCAYVSACVHIPKIASSFCANTASHMGTFMIMGGMAGQATVKAAGAGVKKGFKALKGGSLNSVVAVASALILIFGGAAFASVEIKSSSNNIGDYKDIIDILAPRNYPPDEIYNTVIEKQAELEKMEVSEGEKINAPNIADNGVMVMKDEKNGKGLMTGVYNSSYTNAIDLPCLKFMMGSSENNEGANIDAVKVYEVAYYQLHPDEITSSSNNVQDVGDDELTVLEAKGENVNLILENIRTNVQKYLMRRIPIIILCLMFVIQLARISYLRTVDLAKVGSIKPIEPIARFIISLLAIYFFRYIVCWVVTMFNYMTCAVVPIGIQDDLMTGIASHGLTVISGGSLFWHLLIKIMRGLMMFALKFMLIERDLFLTITIILGPLCIAIGYYKSYANDDAIHGVLSSWIQTFVKNLFTGPLAAILLYCLGIFNVMTAFDTMSATACLITALSFYLATKGLPQMAEGMSGAALGDTTSSYISNQLNNAWKLAGSGAANLLGYVVKKGADDKNKGKTAPVSSNSTGGTVGLDGKDDKDPNNPNNSGSSGPVGSASPAGSTPEKDTLLNKRFWGSNKEWNKAENNKNLEALNKVDKAISALDNKKDETKSLFDSLYKTDGKGHTLFSIDPTTSEGRANLGRIAALCGFGGINDPAFASMIQSVGGFGALGVLLGEKRLQMFEEKGDSLFRKISSEYTSIQKQMESATNKSKGAALSSKSRDLMHNLSDFVGSKEKLENMSREEKQSIIKTINRIETIASQDKSYDPSVFNNIRTNILALNTNYMTLTKVNDDISGQIGAMGLMTPKALNENLITMNELRDMTGSETNRAINSFATRQSLGLAPIASNNLTEKETQYREVVQKVVASPKITFEIENMVNNTNQLGADVRAGGINDTVITQIEAQYNAEYKTSERIVPTNGAEGAVFSDVLREVIVNNNNIAPEQRNMFFCELERNTETRYETEVRAAANQGFSDSLNSSLDSYASTNRYDTFAENISAGADREVFDKQMNDCNIPRPLNESEVVIQRRVIDEVVSNMVDDRVYNNGIDLAAGTKFKNDITETVVHERIVESPIYNNNVIIPVVGRDRKDDDKDMKTK